MVRIYITGLGRANNDYGLLDETHVYEIVDGSYRPLCKRGFNRDFGYGFSIFRGNVGELGVCEVCARREASGKPGLGWKRSRRLKKRIRKLDLKAYSPLLPGLPLKPDLNLFPWRSESDEY